jgi:hypothetical protein
MPQPKTTRFAISTNTVSRWLCISRGCFSTRRPQGKAVGNTTSTRSRAAGIDTRTASMKFPQNFLNHPESAAGHRIPTR